MLRQKIENNRIGKIWKPRRIDNAPGLCYNRVTSL